jgi:hypothetical protein
MGAAIRPWRHAGPHPPALAVRARPVTHPHPRIPATLWVFNQSKQADQIRKSGALRTAVEFANEAPDHVSAGGFRPSPLIPPVEPDVVSFNVWRRGVEGLVTSWPMSEMSQIGCPASELVFKLEPMMVRFVRPPKLDGVHGYRWTSLTLSVTSSVLPTRTA